MMANIMSWAPLVLLRSMVRTRLSRQKTDLLITGAVEKPAILDFPSVHSSLSRIVTNALDSDPSLIPISCKGKFNISFSNIENPEHPGHPEHLKNPEAIFDKNGQIPSGDSEHVNHSDGSGGDPGNTNNSGTSPVPPDSGEDPLRDPDDFVFESEAQAVRMSKAIREAFDVALTPQVIIADANLSALSRRILITRDLLAG